MKIWNGTSNLKLKNKIYGGLASLKKLKKILPQSKPCSVYYAIIESHLHYTDVIWAVFQRENSKLSKDYKIEPSG